MAILTGPQMSINARNKFGDTIVYFRHLGRNVSRLLVKPANPQTEAQGQQRLLMSALGRVFKGVFNMSLWATDAKELTPAGQTYVSAFIKSASAIYGPGSTGVTELLEAYNAHSASDDFQSEAEGLGIGNSTILYAGSVDTIPAGASLFALASYTMGLAASNPDLFDRAPYSTPFASWGSTQVAAFAADISGE